MVKADRTANDDYLHRIKIYDDIIYLVGRTLGAWGGALTGSVDAFVARYDTSGNQVAIVKSGFNSGFSSGADLVFNNDTGDYFVYGYTEGNIDGETHLGSRDVYVQKYNGSHARQWTKIIGGTAYEIESHRPYIAMGHDNSYFVISGLTKSNPFDGETHPSAGNDRIFLSKRSASSGNKTWSKVLDNSTSDFRGLGVDSSGNIYTMFGSSQLRGLYQQSTPDGDVVIAKYNANGDEQWMKATGSSAGKFDYPENMLVTSGGQIYAVGSTDGNTNCSLYALKQDSSCLYNTTFHGLSSAGSFDSFLFKMDGSNDYIGRDYISVYLNGSAPSDTVYLNVTSADTGEFEVQANAASWSSGAGSTNHNVYVYSVQDNTTDGDQTVNLTITTSSSDASWNGLSVTAPVTVTDQDPTGPYIGLHASSNSVTENDSGSQTVTITAFGDRSMTSATTVNLSTHGTAATFGTAGEGRDWVLNASNIVINSGATTGTTTIAVYGDEIDEDNETSIIRISSVSQATEDGDQSANVLIIDDDTVGMRFQHGGADGSESRVSETGSSDTLTVRLTTRPTDTVKLDLTSDDTGEFTVSPSQLTFVPANWKVNQTVTVTGVADGVTDGDITKTVVLSVNTAGTLDPKYDAERDRNKQVIVENID